MPEEIYPKNCLDNAPFPKVPGRYNCPFNNSENSNGPKLPKIVLIFENGKWHIISGCGNCTKFKPPTLQTHQKHGDKIQVE
jgi:hypothetical protein